MTNSNRIKALIIPTWDNSSSRIQMEELMMEGVNEH